MIHPTQTRKNRILFFPLICVCHFLGRHAPELLLKVRYFFVFRRRLNLKNPTDLNEKIIWAKLYSDISAWTDLADKYKVREYVRSKGLEDILVKLYGAWDASGKFDFDSLPETFILKANNGDGKGTNMVVRNKSRITQDERRRVVSTIGQWLRRKNIGLLHAEPQYKGIHPMVIAEEVLPAPEGESSLRDYKIWCFKGKAYYIWTCAERSASGSSAHVLTYDREWNPHPEFSVFNSDYPEDTVRMPRPKNLEKMLKIAERLSEGFPEVRVDLYNTEPEKTDGKIYFGELTFTSHGGFMDYFQPAFLEKAGSLFSISDFPQRSSTLWSKGTV